MCKIAAPAEIFILAWTGLWLSAAVIVSIIEKALFVHAPIIAMKSCLCRVSYSKIMLISKYMWVTCQQWYFKFTDNYFYLKTCTSFLREWQSAKAGWYLINTCDLSSGHFAFCRYNVVWDIIAWDDRDDDNNYGDDDGDDLKPDAVEDVAIWKDANVNVWHENVVEPPLLLVPATTTVQIHQRDKRLNIWGKSKTYISRGQPEKGVRHPHLASIGHCQVLDPTWGQEYDIGWYSEEPTSLPFMSALPNLWE